MRFIRHKIFTQWAVPFLVAGLVFGLVSPVFSRALAQEATVAQAALLNDFSVGAETIDGFRQVYYVFDGKKIYVTEGPLNSYEPAVDREYIAFTKIIQGAGQIFLYHIPTDTTTQITHSGTNLHPRVSGGRVVWRRWVHEEQTWQVFLFDGFAARQLTDTGLSINADIEGDTIIYANKNSQDEWRALRHTIGENSALVIKEGFVARYPSFRDGDVVFEIEELLVRQEAELREREARRLAREEAERKAREEALLEAQKEALAQEARDKETEPVIQDEEPSDDGLETTIGDALEQETSEEEMSSEEEISLEEPADDSQSEESKEEPIAEEQFVEEQESQEEPVEEPAEPETVTEEEIVAELDGEPIVEEEIMTEEERTSDNEADIEESVESDEPIIEEESAEEPEVELEDEPVLEEETSIEEPEEPAVEEPEPAPAPEPAEPALEPAPEPELE